MAARDELLRFVEAARDSGAPDESIAGILKSSGWPDRDVYDTLRIYYERSTGVTVPTRRGIGEGARDAFIQLLSSGTLATWVIALGSLLFSAVDRIWPDEAVRGRNYFSATDLASLLVAFPVFLVVSRVAARDVRQDPSRRETPVRRWLTYMSMLIAAIVVIGDVITFLAYLLQGELTIRFVSKVFVVFVLAGGAFWYYFSSIKPDSGERDRYVLIGSSVAACVGLVVGFWLLGSPAQQREVAVDRKRVEDLRAIARELHARGGTPPESLSELRAQQHDAVTGAEYEYRPLDGTRYQLCATFSAPTQRGPLEPPFWRHEAGRQCFTLDAARLTP